MDVVDETATTITVTRIEDAYRFADMSPPPRFARAQALLHTALKQPPEAGSP